MCIRDSPKNHRYSPTPGLPELREAIAEKTMRDSGYQCDACLLYTSDAADERSSVDLGGRRIIKKKTNTDSGCETIT